MERLTPSADLEGYVPYPDERARAYQAAGYWENRPLFSVFRETVEDHPEKPFLVGPHGETSYATVADRAERVAGYLLGELGLRPGDRLVLQLPNVPAFVELFFGCLAAGVRPVMVLPRHRAAEARHVIELTGASAYVTATADAGFDYPGMVDGIDEAPAHRVAVGEGEVPAGWVAYDELLEDDWAEEHGERLAAVEPNPCDPALFLLSGGTTGMPKAIPRTHNDYAFQWRRMADVADARADWTTLPCIPIGHNASLICVVGLTVVAGATLVVQPELKPGPLLETMEAYGVTYHFAVPAQLVDFLEHPDHDDHDLSALESMISGGQKVRPWSVYAFNERWDTDFLNIFGMAEGPLICTRPDDPVAVQAETVGRPIAPAADAFRIVDDRREAEVDVGEPGELAARGPGVFTGYLRNPEENAENFDDDGWFYTEDVLELGEDGNYRVHGRLKDTIIRGGENIYAPGVEDELIEHPKVANVAVIGMPDDRLGQRPMAYVELEDGVDSLELAELTDFLEERGVAVFKRPERLEVVEALPRTEVGKISKAELTERITETLRAEGSLEER